jgi:RNA polymerase primary sigma factor
MEKIDNLKEVNQLITIGQEKGYLTYEEVNNALPPELVSPDRIDDIMVLFGELNIELVDNGQKGRKSTLSKKAKDDSGDISSIDDPVRLYLREMGGISLLSREGEIKIAKKIEEGENEVINNVLSCPITVTKLIEMESSIKNEEIPIQKFVDWNTMEEEVEVNELKLKEEYKRVLSILKKIRRLNVKLAKIPSTMAELKLKKAKEKLDAERILLKKKIFDTICEINLNSDQVDNFIEIIKEHSEYFKSNQKILNEVEGDLGLSIEEIKKITNNWKKQKKISLKNNRKLTQKEFLELEKIIKDTRRKIRKMEQTIGVSQEEISDTVKAISMGKIKGK